MKSDANECLNSCVVSQLHTYLSDIVSNVTLTIFFCTLPLSLKFNVHEFIKIGFLCQWNFRHLSVAWAGDIWCIQGGK
jgi:hypothetical protein